MQISKILKLISLMLCVVALTSACGRPNDVKRGKKNNTQIQSGEKGVEKLRISAGGRTVKVAGPPGYCVDVSSKTKTRKSTTVILDSCSILGVKADGFSSLSGLFSVSVANSELPRTGGSRSDPIAGLQNFLLSETGKAVISRTGNGSTVKVLNHKRVGKSLYLQIEDRSPAVMMGASTRYWRGYFEISRRLVTISLYEYAGVRLKSDVALRKLLELEAYTRAAN